MSAPPKGILYLTIYIHAKTNGLHFLFLRKNIKTREILQFHGFLSYSIRKDALNRSCSVMVFEIYKSFQRFNKKEHNNPPNPFNLPNLTELSMIGFV